MCEHESLECVIIPSRIQSVDYWLSQGTAISRRRCVAIFKGIFRLQNLHQKLITVHLHRIKILIILADLLSNHVIIFEFNSTRPADDHQSWNEGPRCSINPSRPRSPAARENSWFGPYIDQRSQGHWQWLYRYRKRATPSWARCKASCQTTA